MAAASHGGQAHSTQVEPKAYKSPQRKLVPFFARSRDQWKEKCRSAKASLKQLKKKVQRGEVRSHRQQERLQALAREMMELQAENRRLAAAVATGEKNAR